MEPAKKDSFYVDDTSEGVSLLIAQRLPWLVVGLLAGIILSLLVSRFEESLSQNIRLAFFIPIIVYLSDAVGTQTETIFVRNLARRKLSLLTYGLKELVIGLTLGAVFGLSLLAIIFFWLSDLKTAMAVGLATLVNVSLAPLVALLVSAILFKGKTDPALGAGPFTTALQDFISLLIYFLVAVLIVF